MTEPIVPDPALIRTSAERDAVNQRVLDDLAADHPGLDGALAGPVCPEAMGALLGQLFGREQQPGPPYVHTIEPPRCDLEDCCPIGQPCACACHRVQTTHTVTQVEFATEPYDGPQPSERWFTAPENGRYQITKRLTE